MELVLAALGLAVLLGVVTAWFALRLRRRALVRQQASQRILEALVQDIQGLVLRLQVKLYDLPPDDGQRLRFEHFLDEVDLALSLVATRSEAGRSTTDH